MLLSRPAIVRRCLLAVAVLVSTIPLAVTGSAGATEPASPAPTDNTQLGIATGCCVTPGTTLEAQMPGYAATGAGWARLGLFWNQHEPTPGAFAWPKDAAIAGFRSHGLRVLGVLAYSPAWAADPLCASQYGNKCGPTNPAEFARFAAAAAERYDADGVDDAPGSPRVDAWEIWNEPNLASFWRPAPNPVAYTALLRAAYAAIEAVDPAMTVVTGGLSPAGGTFAPGLFTEAMYLAGAGGHFDALGFHPYSYPALPSKVAAWNAWQQMFQTFTVSGVEKLSLRAVMTLHGDAGKQIWATEYGAPTHGDTNGDGVVRCDDGDGLTQSGEDRCVTEANHARMLTEAVTQWRTFAWAGPLFWYSYQDLGTGGASIEDNFGMVRSDGSAKPVVDAFRALAGPVVEPEPTTTTTVAPTTTTTVAPTTTTTVKKGKGGGDSGGGGKPSKR